MCILLAARTETVHTARVLNKDHTAQSSIKAESTRLICVLSLVRRKHSLRHGSWDCTLYERTRLHQCLQRDMRSTSAPCMAQCQSTLVLRVFKIRLSTRHPRTWSPTSSSSSKSDTTQKLQWCGSDPTVVSLYNSYPEHRKRSAKFKGRSVTHPALRQVGHQGRGSDQGARNTKFLVWRTGN